MKRLYRSRNDKFLCGVCGGLGKYTDVDPVVIRLAWIILMIATAFFPMVIIYIIACIIIPEEPIRKVKK